MAGHGTASLTACGWARGHRRGASREKCCRSSVVERILGKAEVVSSILTGSTISVTPGTWRSRNPAASEANCRAADSARHAGDALLLRQCRGRPPQGDRSDRRMPTTLDTAYDGDATAPGSTALSPTCSSARSASLWVTTGTAANCLALAALCPPYGAILCHRDAHIEIDEAGAPGFFTGGAKLMLLDGPGAKVTPEAVDAPRASASAPTFTRSSRARSASPTPPNMAWPIAPPKIGRARRIGASSAGSAFTSMARGSPMRWPSPAKALPTSRWRAGVDALVVRLRQEWRAQCRGAGAVPHRPGRRNRGPPQARRPSCCRRARMLAAQLLAMLEDDLWLDQCPRRQCVAAPDRRGGARSPASIRSRPMSCSSRSAPPKPRRLRAQGFDFYDWAPGEIRLVASWDQQGAEAVDRLAAAIAAL